MYHVEEKTMAENSTETQQPDSSTVKMPGEFFFDPSWQLALTITTYFKYAVLAIGIIGTAANALVLHALINHNAREAKKRAINLLIINQNLLDLTCCIFLLISICVQIANADGNVGLTGTAGYFVCAIFMYETGTYCALYASIINLVFVTVERYLKVVHPFWSKKRLKRWMIYAAMVFAWAGGIASATPSPFITTRVDDGFCAANFDSEEQGWIYGSCNLFLTFLCPLAIFVYCYGRMVVVMRRQMRVMAGHGGDTVAQAASASQAQSRRVKWNIIKTMIECVRSSIGGRGLTAACVLELLDTHYTL